MTKDKAVGSARSLYVGAFVFAVTLGIFAGGFGSSIDMDWSRPFVSNLICPGNSSFFVVTVPSGTRNIGIALGPVCCVNDLNCQDASGLWTKVSHVFLVFAAIWLASLVYILVWQSLGRKTQRGSRLRTILFLLVSIAATVGIHSSFVQHTGSGSGEMVTDVESADK